jgi:hypothetical protein
MAPSSAPRAVADAGTRLPSRPRGARMGGVAPRDGAAMGRACVPEAGCKPTKIDKRRARGGRHALRDLRSKTFGGPKWKGGP